ncbi:MAG: ATP-grasp domain-containing protein [Actinomycetia bacterium]|nr:ATP-grasp domain-containing protein [Actinomycetes bacterium]MCP4225745.1 ATP-grasp domain-containing protein [Actinomycetes bacterium]
MTALVLVAPYGLESTMKFVSAAAGLPDVQLGLVSHEPTEAFATRLDTDLRDRISGFAQVANTQDPDQLEVGVRDVGRQLGGQVDALAGILEPLQESLAVVRQRLGIRGMDPEEARRFRDKAHMKDVLRANGLPCAKHCLATSAEEALAFADELLPLVAKPPAGAGAVDTFRIDERDQLETWVRSMPPSSHQPILLEEFIQGDEYSFDSVSVGGDHRFHSISSYAPTPLEVMETPWIQWTVLLPRSIDGPEFEPIRQAGPQALSALGMVTGMTHMEWFRRHDGSIAISEVAARPPGAQITTLISYAHDHDFYRAWAELNAFETFEPPERRYATGAAYLRGQGAGAVVDVEGIDEIQRELGPLVVEAQLPRRGQAKSASYEGEGYVILRHPETEVVESGLKQIVSSLRVHLGNDDHGGSP